MRRNLTKLIVLFNFFLIKTAFPQVLMNESFPIFEKGAWGSASSPVSDLSDVPWSVDVQNCTLSDEGDYAKTVSTSGGRFEVLDTDGEALWISPHLATTTGQNLRISFTAAETGSNTATDKKYIRAFLKIDGTEFPFTQNDAAVGNWGTVAFTQVFTAGTTAQLIVQMNSSYSSDKVYIDDVKIEQFETVVQIPHSIQTSGFPAFAKVGVPFTITAFIQDTAKNIILDKRIDLNVEPAANATFVGFSNGVFTWNITGTQARTQTFRIVDPSSTLPSAEHPVEFFSSENSHVQALFEMNDWEGWNANNHWELSAVNPISGNQSVRHLEQTENGTSTLSNSTVNSDGNSADFYGSFKIRNGDWDPSSSNGFFFYFIEKETSGNGYAIGVNANGSTDKLSLWTYISGKATELLAETEFDWNANTTARIDFSRLSNGAWTLACTDLATGLSSQSTAMHALYSDFTEVGLSFFYTATRSGKLWFDDLEVFRKNSGPQLKLVSATSSTSIDVWLSEPVGGDPLTTSNFKLADAQGTTLAIEAVEKIDSKHIRLTVAEMGSTTYTLSAFNISDVEGTQTPLSTFNFTFKMKAKVHDVVFTEIMADPSPVVGLPNVEFIEIHNRSTKSIHLENWKLKVDNTTRTLFTQTVNANEYVLLCHANDSALLAPFGKVIPVDRFQGLRNSYALLQLLNEEDELVDEVRYAEAWYNDAAKKSGGWTLERMDNNRFCGAPGNWSASVAELGGTPGQPNSIAAPNPDEAGPQLLYAQVSAANAIQAVFNEPLDAESYTIQNILISPTLEIDSCTWKESEQTLVIVFTQNMEENVPYTLVFSTLTDACQNTSTNATAKFSRVRIKPGDVLINEVLFDPFSGGSDFVELYNTTALNLDLSKLKLATRNDTLALKSVYTLAARPEGFAPQSYLAVTTSYDGVANFYHLPCPECVAQTTNLPTFANELGTVVLLNDSLEVIDEFTYTAKMHSPMLSDPDGVSLERISLTVASQTASNWQSASSVVGYATPGYRNSQGETHVQQAHMELSCDVVSPNNDLFNDELEITIDLPQNGCMLDLYVFDLNGRLQAQLAKNQLVGTNERFVFEGSNEKGTNLAAGPYILLAEAYHPKGFTFSKKMVFAIVR